MMQDLSEVCCVQSNFRPFANAKWVEPDKETFRPPESMACTFNCPREGTCTRIGSIIPTAEAREKVERRSSSLVRRRQATTLTSSSEAAAGDAITMSTGRGIRSGSGIVSQLAIESTTTTGSSLVAKIVG